MPEEQEEQQQKPKKPDYYYSPSAKAFYVDDVEGQVIPEDKIGVNSADHATAMQALSQGKAFQFNETGQITVFVPTPPAPTSAQQIRILEADITPRRIREAVLGLDEGWLENINSQIAALRSQI